MNISGISKKGMLRNVFLKSKVRIILWLLFLALVFIVSFLILGYYSAFKGNSYLPAKIPANLGTLISERNTTEIINKYYKLKVDQSGKVAVETLNGEIILSGLTYYAQYEGKKGSYGLNNIKVLRSDDSTISIKGTNNRNATVILFLITHKHLSKLDVLVKTVYNNDTTLVEREALLAAFSVPVTEVYRKNRMVDTADFDPEYWLDKEGARFGSNARSALIYHTPMISSLQLQTSKNLLFINLDFYLDHPHAIMPFHIHGDANSLMEVVSKAKYLKGSERTNSFSINFGEQATITPRLMLVPSGFEAGYIFTEHADGGTIRTNRAAYFGSEDITNAKDATGGFVAYKIPVTKSVFYVDSNGVASSAIFEKDKATSFLFFLNQLQATGLYDICMHTPENLNSSRKVLEESIPFLKEHFDTKSWIDHGFYGGKINRECLVADGLDKNSKFYAADLWEKYDTRYFWSPAVEYIHETSHISLKDEIKHFKFLDASTNFWKQNISPRELKKMSFFAALNELINRYKDKFELNSLMSDNGDAYPTPLYWQNPTWTKNFYSWTTDFVQSFSVLSPAIVEEEQKQTDNLVKNRGVFISHGYYVEKENSDVIISDEKGKFIVNPYFNEILSNLAQKRDKGQLFITTIREFLDYQIKLEHISFEYLAGGEIEITNNNNEPIKGLSLVLRTNKKVSVEGKVPSMKRLGDDTLIWFNLEAKETVRLNVNGL